MLYQIKDGTVSAGGQTILSHIDFYIKEKEKIAVVGKNGAGKTTLLRLLAGELTPDRDDSRGSYGRSNDMVTGAATAGSDLDGKAKRTQRAKRRNRRETRNRNHHVQKYHNWICLDRLINQIRIRQSRRYFLRAARIKIPFQKRGLTTRWSTTGFLQALALKKSDKSVGISGAFQEENRRRFL